MPFRHPNDSDHDKTAVVHNERYCKTRSVIPSLSDFFFIPCSMQICVEGQHTAANQFGTPLGAFNVKQYSTILSRILHESFMHQDNQIWKVIIVINYGTSLIILS